MNISKILIFSEMLVIWIGSIDHYKNLFGGDYAQTVVHVGVRTAVPYALLGFWLFLAADMGAGTYAALVGFIVAFSYLLGAATTLNDLTDYLLNLSPDPTQGGSFKAE